MHVCMILIINIGALCYGKYFFLFQSTLEDIIYRRLQAIRLIIHLYDIVMFINIIFNIKCINKYVIIMYMVDVTL